MIDLKMSRSTNRKDGPKNAPKSRRNTTVSNVPVKRNDTTLIGYDHKSMNSREAVDINAQIPRPPLWFYLFHMTHWSMHRYI